MFLHVDSEAAYLTMPKARSCYAVNLYLSDGPSPIPIKPNPDINGTIHIECKTIYNVVISSAEDETCGKFNTGNIYRHATRINHIGPQTTSDTPLNK